MTISYEFESIFQNKALKKGSKTILNKSCGNKL